MARKLQEQPKKNEQPKPKKGNQLSKSEKPKIFVRPEPKKIEIEEQNFWEQELKEQLAEAKRREEGQEQIEKPVYQTAETGEVQVGGERYPHSAYEAEESPETEALRLAIRERIDYYDQRLQVLEKAFTSKKPLEIIQLAAIEKNLVEDPEFSKLFFARRLKPAITKYYEKIGQKVETLRKVNSALDPEYELGVVFSADEIDGHDLVSVKDAAQDKAADIQIDRDLKAEAGTEGADAAEEAIIRESITSYGAARRRTREDLIGAVKKIQQRRQKQRTGAEVRDEISDFSGKDFAALQNFIDNPDEFEKAKESLPQHLAEVIEDLILEKQVKKPLREKINAKIKELELDWSNLKTKLAAAEDPLATLAQNLATIGAFLGSFDELKQLKTELELAGKKPDVKIIPETETDQKAVAAYSPLITALEIKFEQDALRLSVKIVAKKTIEAIDKTAGTRKRNRLKKRLAVLSRLTEADNIELAYQKMLDERIISRELDEEIHEYIKLASRKLAKKSMTAWAK